MNEEVIVFSKRQGNVEALIHVITQEVGRLQRVQQKTKVFQGKLLWRQKTPIVMNIHLATMYMTLQDHITTVCPPLFLKLSLFFFRCAMIVPIPIDMGHIFISPRTDAWAIATPIVIMTKVTIKELR